MRWLTKTSRLLGIGIALLGAACSAPATPTLLPTPEQQAVMTPLPSAAGVTPAVDPTPDIDNPTPAPDDGSAAAIRAAITLASATLSIPEGEFVLASEPLFIEWADTSLGCPEEGQTYQQQVTPGYLITLNARGASYEVHTDRTDRAVLCLADGQSVGAGGVRDPIVAEFILVARGRVAEQQGVPLDQVVLVRSEALTWSSSALGCQPPTDEPVTNVDTPGYRIELVVGDQRFYFHADQQRMIQCDDPLE